LKKKTHQKEKKIIGKERKRETDTFSCKKEKAKKR
jgi:hypothetical protein